MPSNPMPNPTSNRTTLEKNFLFIIGSPRSGTMWLQLMIGGHPLVCATTELRLYNKYTAPWLEAWKGEALLTEEGKRYEELSAWPQENRPAVRRCRCNLMTR
jgi:hypothetical protein